MNSVHAIQTVKEELLRNPQMMTFGLWLFTVLCVAIAIIFGLVSSIFAIINTVMTPIEVISGIQGLYLWNGMGGKYPVISCQMSLSLHSVSCVSDVAVSSHGKTLVLTINFPSCSFSASFLQLSFVQVRVFHGSCSSRRSCVRMSCQRRR